MNQVDGVMWLNPTMGSFDSFGSAMLLLYIMSTGDGWEDAMYMGMNVVGPGLAPVRNDFSPNSLFFIAWMFIGGFFAINLFVGTICDNFSQMKAEADGSATMTNEQQQWAQTLKTMTYLKASRSARMPTDPLRQKLFVLVTARPFDMFIMGVIVANILLMACDYWRIEEDEQIKAWYDGVTLVFSYIYYAEAALKMSGIGLHAYFRDSWCRFDFFLVCVLFLDQFGAELLEALLPVPPMLLRVLRVFRILRILKVGASSAAAALAPTLSTGSCRASAHTL